MQALLNDIELDVFDVLVGINLLREGLDIPEISLVAILDADKEGFLRSATSLIQTVGRAARNAEGHVIMYADTITDSMRITLDETARRRAIQQKYNEEHNITPQTIKKAVRDLISISKAVAKEEQTFAKDPESMDEKELKKLIATTDDDFVYNKGKFDNNWNNDFSVGVGTQQSYLHKRLINFCQHRQTGSMRPYTPPYPD